MVESGGIPGNVTILLQNWARGHPSALDDAIPKIYAELRRLAETQLRRRPANGTLSAPALVNELYIRLSTMNPVVCENRARFLALSAVMMRCFIVDHVRARRAHKRGGQAVAVTLSDVAKPDLQSDPDVLDVDIALNGLALVNELQAQIIEMRYFGGLSIEETARSLDLSPATVKRHFVMGRAWMKDRLVRRSIKVGSPGVR